MNSIQSGRTVPPAPGPRRIAKVLPVPLTPIAIILFPIQFFLGLGWIRAGVDKLTTTAWWHGTALRAFLHEHSHGAIAFMPTVASRVIEPLAMPVGLLVMLTQPLIGLSLITGRALRPALAWAITLNLVFVLMGEVTPSVFYLVIELALLTAVATGAIGRSPRPPSPTAALLWTAGALAAIPFVGTLAPADVIRDPGIILVTVATVAASTQALRLLAKSRPYGALDQPPARTWEMAE
jgi:hypothetical protein